MINWATWQPRTRVNLVFIVHKRRILLIRKKRGFGAGKINGPGGKVDPGETPLAAALREIMEELEIMPIGAHQHAELHFQFHDGNSVHCTVFLAHDYKGEPRETPEAVPLWTPLDQIPYDEMWAGDRYWLPLLLRGEHFKGYFEFDEERLISQKIVSQS
jgi:8-oxo-dGTP diphosphatase